ncbi:MAG TPA: methylmalonyl-CoA mutase family protein, partial [Acidimicrobiales bacterium]|nr:methylmalonyl-CoA mutase family protein [Acidimicrobiales bacterium]
MPPRLRAAAPPFRPRPAGRSLAARAEAGRRRPQMAADMVTVVRAALTWSAMGAHDEITRRTGSGIEVRTVYGPADLQGWDPEAQLGEPGRYPFTRGVHPDMYRRRLWTMR